MGFKNPLRDAEDLDLQKRRDGTRDIREFSQLFYCSRFSVMNFRFD